MNTLDYSPTADELVRRIVALIPEHPEILDMVDPWALFKVPGFDCSDLGPSYYQATWALAKARQAGTTKATPPEGA